MKCPNCSCSVFKTEIWKINNMKFDIDRCVYCGYIMTKDIESIDMEDIKTVMKVQRIITEINSNIIDKHYES